MKITKKQLINIVKSIDENKDVIQLGSVDIFKNEFAEKNEFEFKGFEVITPIKNTHLEKTLNTILNQKPIEEMTREELDFVIEKAIKKVLSATKYDNELIGRENKDD